MKKIGIAVELLEPNLDGKTWKRKDEKIRKVAPIEIPLHYWENNRKLAEALRQAIQALQEMDLVVQYKSAKQNEKDKAEKDSEE